MGDFFNRNRMWFGTEQKMGWIETPMTGADVSPEGFGTSATGLNGLGYVRNSWDAHKVFQFSWGESADRALASKIHAYRNGTYGRGLIYFTDPMYYDTNILPRRIADPSMAANFEAAPLIPDMWPRSTPTGANNNDLPVNTAIYDVQAGYDAQAAGDETFVPIPPDFTLNLGAVYSTPNSQANLYYRTPAGTFPFTPLLPGATNLHPDSVVGQPWVRIGLRNSEPGVRQNLATNPSFETGAGAVEVWRNRYIPAGIGFSNSVGGTALSIIGAYSGGYLAVTPGEKISLKAFGAPGNRRQYGFSATTPTVKDVALFGVVNQGNGSGLEAVDVLVPAGAAYMAIYASNTGVDTRVLAVSEASNPFRWLFDGAGLDASTPDPDLSPAWTGAANASASILTGVKVASMYTAASQTVDYQHAYGGGRILRALSITDDPKGINFNPPGMAASTKYTILLRARASKTIPVVVRIGGIASSSETLTTEWQDIRATGTAGATPSGTGFLVSGGNAMPAGEWIDVEHVAIVEGAYGGPWFDGSTPGATWDGAPNASTSSWEVSVTPISVTAVTGRLAPPGEPPLTTGPWMTGEGHSGCQFVGSPTLINYNGVNGGQVGLACTLSETGAWL